MVSTVVLFPLSLRAEDTPATAPLSAEQTAQLTKSLEKVLEDSAKTIEAEPKNVNAYSRHGDACFFLGKFDQAVADYDQMIKLEESLSNSHWRRGIALFYAGKYKEAAAQFDRYHLVDQVDRENGIWQFLSQHKGLGKDKAREDLLKYEKDDREPFPAVYKLFAGTITPADILAQIEAAEISKVEREKRLFYSHLYIGLNYAVEDNPEAAQRHLRLATQNTWGPAAGYGPNYMWHVGRLHEELLRKQAEKK
jgi:lipoprotein NlpI